MSFEVVWSDFAEFQLDKIFEYYLENASLRVAKDLVRNIVAEPEKLINNPEISEIEELLLDREDDYRYLVYKNYKIIFSVDQRMKLIKVADVFDTRQNPIEIKRTK